MCMSRATDDEIARMAANRFANLTPANGETPSIWSDTTARSTTSLRVPKHSHFLRTAFFAGLLEAVFFFVVARLTLAFNVLVTFFTPFDVAFFTE